MSVSDADIAFARELFAGLGPLTQRKMMGGLCLYHEGTIFSILNADGSIWLKGAGAWADHMTAQGWPRWSYTRKDGRTTEMPYWLLPDSALDDPDLACDLAKSALAQL